MEPYKSVAGFTQKYAIVTKLLATDTNYSIIVLAMLLLGGPLLTIDVLLLEHLRQTAAVPWQSIECPIKSMAKNDRQGVCLGNYG